MENNEGGRSWICEKYIAIFGEDIKQSLILLFNLIFGTMNRIIQIIYYCMKRYAKNENKGFGVDTIKQASLTFCILPTCIDAFMMGLYCLLHSEENLTIKLKIKKFFLFIISMEFLFPLGVHLSLRTKYSYNADNILNVHDVDLLLSGHSHNGNIRIPYLGTIFSYNGAKKYKNDYYKIKNNSLYVSSGLGTRENEIRLFCHPSVYLFRISNS